MNTQWIYLDHHATTPCDPRVLEAMTPLLLENFGNAHSPHAFGLEAEKAWQAALRQIATSLGALPDELVITSGATESNNLAIFGVAQHPRQKRRHLITVTSEHPAVLDPMEQLERSGYRVTRLPVLPQGDARAGMLDLGQLEAALEEDTALVSVMAANNEIGVLQPMREIAELCHRHGALLHCDATQAVGRIPVNIAAWDVDLLSASAHKFYGPKGVGLLVINRRARRVRVRPMIWGGGQQHGLRSGTVNVAGAVGMATALQIADQQRDREASRIGALRDHLWRRLSAEIEDCQLNGPPLSADCRLQGNLNVCFPTVEGESLMSAVPQLAVSSGAACSSVDPAPSHVLAALGLSESAARRSLRFGLGRFNTEQQIDRAADALAAAYHQLAAAVR
jgi:cysteine desulfurase